MAAPDHLVSNPSKITVPKRCHPAAKIVFAEMRRQGVTYDELEYRSGVLKSTFKAWRTHNKPGLESIQAALGALGWEFLPMPRLENLPESVRAKLAEAAEEWGSEDDLLCELLAEIAHSPRLDRARLLASAAPAAVVPYQPKKARAKKRADHPEQAALFAA